MTIRRAFASLALLAIFAASVATAQPADLELAVESNIQEAYLAGEAYEIDFSIRLVDPDALVERAVLFLNVVENDPARNYPQAAHLIFESAEETVEIFRIPFDGETLREGLETSIRIRFRLNVPEGAYSIVFQAFEGEQTNPNQVRIEDRVAIRSFPFTLER